MYVKYLFLIMKLYLYKVYLFLESELEEDWECGEICDVMLLRDGVIQGLGFSIRGGLEYVLGVYVSEVIFDFLVGMGIFLVFIGFFENG